jgi:hypothetical protein
MIELRRAGARWPHGDPNDIVRSILHDPAYRERPLAALREPSLWERFLHWLQGMLRPFFERLAGVLGASSKLGSVFGYVLIALAFLALAVLIAQLLRAYYDRAPLRAAGPRAAGIERERSFGEWRALATACAERGEYARAIHALFAAALAGLHERALVPFDPARTPGEYRRLVRGAKASAAPAFDALSERFVYASYAPIVAGRAEYEAAARAFSLLEPDLRRA